jgi:predicted Fe-Mo cluster-binding NifX family protein
MKIAISSTGTDLDDQVDLRFGRCRCFILVDDKAEQFEVLDNSAAASTSGAGIQASQMIADTGVQVIITGNIGTNAIKTLEAAGIKTYHCGPGTVRKALQKYKDGMLQETSGYKVGGTGAGGGFRRGGGVGGGRGLGGGARRA